MDTENTNVTLYSPQSKTVWRVVEAFGSAHSRREYVKEKYGESAVIFLTAYDAYIREAEKIVPRPDRNDYPYWAFAAPEQIDLSGGGKVMTLSVPKDEVVFFDQYDWYKVLKLSYIGDSERDEADFVRELEKRGILADFVPSVYDGDTLGRELGAQLAGGERILLPRAAVGNQTLVEELEKAGAQVDDIATYDTVDAPAGVLDEKALFEEGKIDCAVFTSASTVRGFAAQTEGLDYSTVAAACIGKQTLAAADALGMQTFMAEKATMDSLAELVVRMKGERK